MTIKVVNKSGDERVISDIEEYGVTRSESDVVLTIGRQTTINVGDGETVYVMSDAGKTIDTYKGN